MDKKTRTWLETAQNDIEFAGQILVNKQRPFYALHFCHQAIEKILKAAIQHQTDTIPPRTHSLEKLLRLAKKELPPEMLETLLNLSPHYLSTKYLEDVAEMQQQYSEKFVQSLLKPTRELFQWVKKN
ncbi:MAG: HEPN domain-containing protein [Deltaproteobacteria bacterium]|nr:HEPN domain-containing protein [Deltaproteobacteria bacterium]